MVRVFSSFGEVMPANLQEMKEKLGIIMCFRLKAGKFLGARENP